MLQPNDDQSHCSSRTSTKSQFTFGRGYNSQASLHPLELQLIHPNSTGRFLDTQNSNLHPFASHFGQSSSREIRRKLEELEHGPYLCYKYFVAIMCVLEGFSALLSVLNLFFDEGNIDFLMHVSAIFLLGWHSYQLFIEFRAINLKNYSFAERAVFLMKWYMVALAVVISLGLSILTSKSKDSLHSDLLLKGFLAIVVAEGAFYLLYLYGALKVRDLLSHIKVMQGEYAYYEGDECA